MNLACRATFWVGGGKCLFILSDLVRQKSTCGAGGTSEPNSRGSHRGRAQCLCRLVASCGAYLCNVTMLTVVSAPLYMAASGRRCAGFNPCFCAPPHNICRCRCSAPPIARLARADVSMASTFPLLVVQTSAYDELMQHPRPLSSQEQSGYQPGAVAHDLHHNPQRSNIGQITALHEPRHLSDAKCCVTACAAMCKML